MKILLFAVLLALGSAPVSGQSLELQAGASNLLDASGVSAIYSTGDYAAEISVGVAANRFVYGATYDRNWRGCTWSIGDHQEYYSTTVAGLSASSRGVATECKTKTQTVRVFTGAIGELHATPYFSATSETRHFGSGFEYTRLLGDFEFNGVSAIAGKNKVFLEGVKFHRDAFRVEESAGLAQGQKYFEGVASVQERHFSASLIHADYFGLSTVNSEQVTAGSTHLSVFASAFQSKVSGQAFGASSTVGRITSSIMTLNTSGQKRQISEFFTEQVSQHIMATQAVNGKNVSFGGGLQGNLISASVGFQELYVPAIGFEQATTFNLRLQLPRGTVNISLSKLPSGIFYTGYAGLFAEGPALGGGSIQSHAAP